MHNLPFSFGIIDSRHLRYQPQLYRRATFLPRLHVETVCPKTGHAFQIWFGVVRFHRQKLPGTNEVYMMMTVETLARGMCLLLLISIQ